VKYFLPDSQDLVDPSFDFETEGRSRTRIRQRDDVYAHELFPDRVFDGILVSKGIVDGFGASSGRYTMAQRHRLLRVGAPEFFRLKNAKVSPVVTMGDCGAFTYVSEEVPPYTVDDLIEFYADCEFDYGISLDHVILEYQPSWDKPRALAPETREAAKAAKRRQEVTLELADKFLQRAKREKLPFRPMGVAQGWSADSYAFAIRQLQKMGYVYIAVGGMVPLKTIQVEESLVAMNAARAPGTTFHLLGVTRTERLPAFTSYGVTSFDSTSPLRQAFKDDSDNYYAMDRCYTAIRIPQVEGNAKLERSIKSGKTSQNEARALEKACLKAMAQFDRGEATIDETIEALRKYDELFVAADGRSARARRDQMQVYREVLEAAPWRQCPCAVCRALGHHVILFRGAERNRRRGLHNIWVFYRRVQREISAIKAPTGRAARARAKTMENRL
jgi:hypothetical protein